MPHLIAVYLQPTLSHVSYAQILRKHRKQSTIKSKPAQFNFQSSQIVGKVQRVTGKKWKVSLDGSAQVSALHTHKVSTLCIHLVNCPHVSTWWCVVKRLCYGSKTCLGVTLRSSRKKRGFGNNGLYQLQTCFVPNNVLTKLPLATPRHVAIHWLSI